MNLAFRVSDRISGSVFRDFWLRDMGLRFRVWRVGFRIYDFG